MKYLSLFLCIRKFFNSWFYSRDV